MTLEHQLVYYWALGTKMQGDREMKKPPKQLVDAFFDWFHADPHSESEDYYQDTITFESLSSLRHDQFVEFFFQFARDGGRIQSGGHRTAHRFRKTVEERYSDFHDYVLRPFVDTFDESKWLDRISEFKAFGRGLGSIYLNRVDKRRFPLLNNKSKQAMELFGVSLPTSLAKSYESLRQTQQQLIDWYPEFDNFFRVDALTHFLIGTPEGTTWRVGLGGEEPSYWVYAPGQGAKHWDRYFEKGLMGIGWDELATDLSSRSEAEVKSKYEEAYGEKSTATDFKQVCDFVLNMKVGDRVLVKHGISEIVGFGEVTSDYSYDSSQQEYRHLRRADWTIRGAWKIEENMKKLPVKTLTKLSDASQIARLRSLIGLDASPSLFTEHTFAFLRALHENPTSQFYGGHIDEFKTHVEAPLKHLMKSVAEQLPETIRDLMETEKRTFSRIPKNDFGKGGAWHFYWSAFYPKGGKRTTASQLFVLISQHVLEMGFSLGELGSDSRARFLKNCSENVPVLQTILGANLSDDRLVFGVHGEPGKYRLPEAFLSLDKWLENPEKHGVQAALVFSPAEAQTMSVDQLIGTVTNLFERLFPLILLAHYEEPLAEIGRYLELGEDGPDPNPEYSLNQCAKETLFVLEDLEKYVRAIESKKQAIFFGPPGTGKTFIAQKLAKHLIGGGDGFTETVQFHPSYSYEDFMQGLRPKSAGDGGLEYVMVPGRFKDFCNRARDCKGCCVLIVDEINRANLSRVFGEIMFLLEYREYSIPLAGGGTFQIPANVRILGTMNTADRSIALVDHAMRRRFAFLGFYPNYRVLRKFHESTGFDPEGLIKKLELINAAINDKHYSIGISFFLDRDIRDKLQDVWQMEIEPYIEELFFDQANKAANFSWEKIKNEILPE